MNCRDSNTLYSHSEVSYAVEAAAREWELEDGPLRRVIEDEYEDWTETSDAACKIIEDFHRVVVQELSNGQDVWKSIEHAHAMVMLAINSVNCPEANRKEMTDVANESYRAFAEHFFGS